MELKSVLLDILKHTTNVGIEHIKVHGTPESTNLEAIDSKKTVFLQAELYEPVEDFVGEFGMGNLGLLSNIMNFTNYNNGKSDIRITREERKEAGIVPTVLNFMDEYGNNDQYRFMSKAAVEDVMKVGKFKGATWDVVITPSADKVQQLVGISGVYSNIDKNFVVKTEDNNLIFEVGSFQGGIAGRRKFAENIDGELKNAWTWNLNGFLNILKLGLTGSTTLKFSDQGVCMFIIDSGVSGIYTYIMPTLSR